MAFNLFSLLYNKLLYIVSINVCKAMTNISAAIISSGCHVRMPGSCHISLRFLYCFENKQILILMMKSGRKRIEDDKTDFIPQHTHVGILLGGQILVQ